MQITVRGRHVGVSEKLCRHARNWAGSGSGAHFSNAIITPDTFERGERVDIGEPPAVTFLGSGHDGLNATFWRRNAGIGWLGPEQAN